MHKNLTYNEETKNEILQYLLGCQSIFVWGILDSVAADLNHMFPTSEVYSWLSPNFTKTTVEDLLDDRSTSVVFLRRLMSQDLQDTNERLKDGITMPNVQKIINSLTELPSFDVAINTWSCICVEWLAICNVDEILERLKKNRPLPQNVNIAKLLVGARELSLM